MRYMFWVLYKRTWTGLLIKQRLDSIDRNLGLTAQQPYQQIRDSLYSISACEAHVCSFFDAIQSHAVRITHLALRGFDRFHLFLLSSAQSKIVFERESSQRSLISCPKTESFGDIGKLDQTVANIATRSIVAALPLLANH